MDDKIITRMRDLGTPITRLPTNYESIGETENNTKTQEGYERMEETVDNVEQNV